MSSETRPLTRCKQRRLDRGLRLVDVSERAGISVSYVSMIESGYIPKQEIQIAVAQALETTSEDLW